MSESALRAAVQDFINKVDSGRARSVDSYNKFKAALAATASEEPMMRVFRCAKCGHTFGSEWVVGEPNPTCPIVAHYSVGPTSCGGEAFLVEKTDTTLALVVIKTARQLLSHAITTKDNLWHCAICGCGGTGTKHSQLSSMSCIAGDLQSAIAALDARDKPAPVQVSICSCPNEHWQDNPDGACPVCKKPTGRDS